MIDSTKKPVAKKQSSLKKQKKTVDPNNDIHANCGLKFLLTLCQKPEDLTLAMNRKIGHWLNKHTKIASLVNMQA